MLYALLVHQCTQSTKSETCFDCTTLYVFLIMHRKSFHLDSSRQKLWGAYHTRPLAPDTLYMSELVKADLWPSMCQSSCLDLFFSSVSTRRCAYCLDIYSRSTNFTPIWDIVQNLCSLTVFCSFLACCGCHLLPCLALEFHQHLHCHWASRAMPTPLREQILQNIESATHHCTENPEEGTETDIKRCQ